MSNAIIVDTYETADISELLEAALIYEAHGWQCVPADGKSPNVAGWPTTEYSIEGLEQHLSRAIEPALGVKFGAETGMVDFEFDTDAQRELMLELFDRIPNTLRFKSKHGEHWLFQYDARLAGRHTISLDASDGTKLIIRCGNAAQSVFPPSRHKKWIIGPDDGILQPMPEAVIQRLLEAKPELRSSTETVGTVDGACFDAMLRIQPQDSEHDGSRRLFAVCCRAVEHNLTDEDAIATIREYELSYPFPKRWSDSEIELRIRQAERRTDVIRGSETTIRVDNDIPRVLSQSCRALANGNDVFQNGHGQLVRYVQAPEPCKFATTDNRSPRLVVVKRTGMLEALTNVSKFQYWKEGRKNEDGKWVEKRPDKDLREAIHCRQDYPGVKVANGVVSSPILLPTGQIVTKPGYNPDTGLVLNVDGDWPELMDNPTAVSKLEYVFADFPFDGPSHFAACIVALLTLLCRYQVCGNTPFFPFDGNRPGCGKGLATDVLTLIAEGRRASRYTFTGKQDELRKALTALALAGRNYMLFDNVKGRFGGAVLEAAMTTGSISDRILGASKNVEVALPITWLATVNGMTYERDMMRRSVPIMLNTAEKNPQLREGFKEPDLLAYVQQHRRELLIAGLSIVANYLRAGKPNQGLSAFGSFQEWSDLLRSAVVFAGLADPCEHCMELYAELSDDVTNSTDELMAAWPFEKPQTVKKALQLIDENPQEYQALVELLHRRDDDRTNAEYLGKMLRAAKGQIRNGQCFTNTGGSRPKWFIEKMIG